jgi:hypothetical protein
MEGRYTHVNRAAVAIQIARSSRILFSLGEWGWVVIAIVSDPLGMTPPTDGDPMVASCFDLAAGLARSWLAVATIVFPDDLVNPRNRGQSTQSPVRNFSHMVFTGPLG